MISTSKDRIIPVLLVVCLVFVVLMAWLALVLFGGPVEPEPRFIPEDAVARVIAGHSVKVSVNNAMPDITHITVYLIGDEWHRQEGSNFLVNQEMAEMANELVDDYIINHPKAIVTGYKLEAEVYPPDDCDSIIVSIYYYAPKRN